ncbi:hypothetical protein E1162_15055 [Rhodobacteraceae bacterium RKSG542]|uniref:hypothetical protein n=1 Tax=Pseudovibrio flavus TaxID=2529854 RepID=UPI00211BC1AE|nr:hypothetical protein [Pseudovibrio flavus]MTI18562.1 hypothetical protein [Pseudovibrio flavus]
MTAPIIQLTSNNDIGCFFRQMPDSSGCWGKYQFKLHNGKQQADWLVAYDEPHKNCETDLPISRRILFRTEPQSIKAYSDEFLKQFGTVVAIDPDPSFRGQTIISQVALPWMYGIDFEKPQQALKWDDLLLGQSSGYKGELSVVCSNKKINLNQERRLRFLAMLKEVLGDRLTIYGRGFKPIGDKREAIDGYRYHLVLENNLLSHGWTEKLADPILGGAYPISAGADNLSHYFNPNGFACINITAPRQAVADVLSILESDPARSARSAMEENRLRLLTEHNFFPLCSSVIDTIRQKSDIETFDRLSRSFSFRPNKRPKLDRLMSIPRPIRSSSRRLYLTLFERK